MIKEYCFYADSQLASRYIIIWIFLRYRNDLCDTIINLRAGGSNVYILPFHKSVYLQGSAERGLFIYSQSIVLDAVGDRRE